MKRKRTLQIEKQIAQRVLNDPKGVTGSIAEKFQISRQAAHRHVERMVDDGVLKASGSTKGRHYELLPLVLYQEDVQLVEGLREHEVWQEQVADHVRAFPKNVFRICSHGFTEMLNNAIDHSQGTIATISVEVNAAAIELQIADDGVGIFRKIREHQDLPDERDALFRLTKGKLTTDPTKHSGEGIFFTSRMFDRFEITSGELRYRHGQDGDVAISDAGGHVKGTIVQMLLLGDTTRTTDEVFNQYSSVGDSLSFSRTTLIVQLMLRQYESLISRSQGKRLLAGVEGFKEVVLDFEGVDSIGQAFADEVFRVFPSSFPNIEIIPINASRQVMGMILRAETP